jgi:D-alanyl-D-alanine carboxypeptidase
MTKGQSPLDVAATPVSVLIGNSRRGAWRCFLYLAGALLAFSVSAPETVFAGPALVIEMPSGAILYEDQATQPWYPASLTKLMTVYVALSAVRDHHITLDTPLAVSARAASMPPSKMGFRPGTLVTLDNALKMLMVKSANDMAVVIAEGVSGSVEAFADDMNSAARELGLTQSHFVNPNGLPNPQHVSSARDLAILARALYLTFPEQADLFNIGALRLGNQIIRNHNDLLGRYPGVDGMKTGFTCAAGFNLVASATRGGRKLIAVILGAPNLRSRMIMAAALFDRGFARIDQPTKSLADLMVQTSANSPAAAPDMGQSVCRKRGKLTAEFNSEIGRVMAPLLARAPKTPSPSQSLALMTAAAASPLPMATYITSVPRPEFVPVPVYLGPPAGYAGLVAQARPPHSPIGTAAPPETVSAYAAAEGQAGEQTGLPLAPAPDALPMKGEAARGLGPSPSTKPLIAKHAKPHRRGGLHREAVAARPVKHAPPKTAHAEHTKAEHTKAAPAKAASGAKADAHAKLAAKQHVSAKSAVQNGKTKSKKPEKQAKQ